jgi:hypothetical protein
MPRKKKPKKVGYELIPEPTGKDPASPWESLRKAVAAWHRDLSDARIALVWALAWTADKDGLLTLGKAKRASDVDRELKEYDLVILLNRPAWKDLKDEQRLALIDHELCHLCLVKDEKGEPKLDERGRQVFRMRKHDVEEFRAVVERHGCYKADLEEFVRAVRRKKAEPLFSDPRRN